MNQIIVSGRVSKEISVKGKVGYITLANDREYPFNKDQNGNKVSNFLTLKFLGEKNIERARQWLVKGTAIIVTGHYFRDSWKESNEYKEFNYIQVDKWEFQTGKATESNVDEQEEATPQDQPQQQKSTEQKVESDASSEGFMDVPDDDSLLNDLPFRK